MIDLKSVQNSSKNIEIDEITYIQSEHYIFSDALKKIEEDLILLHTLRKSKLDHPIGQLISRRTLHLEQKSSKSNC